MYSKISQKINTQDISTITLDVFDTILLRKTWPEDLQFYQVAKKWQPVFAQYFSQGITPDELYSFRIYARQELIAINRQYNTGSEPKNNFSLESNLEYDVNLNTWFSKTIDLLTVKHRTKLNAEQRQTILAKMIQVEIDTEKQNLIPNIPLIDTITRLKRQHRGLKVFFVSDMYLTSSDIEQLLNYFQINIFDGGVTSTETKHTKATGRMFDYLHQSKILCDDFNLSHNLHIGDSQTSDFKNALIAGSDAILYHQIRFRRLKTLLGRFKTHQMRQDIFRHDRQLVAKINRHSNNPAKIWQAYGQLFAQPLFVFLQHLANSVAESPETSF